MLKFKVDAKILLTIIAEQLKEAEIAEVLLILENSFNAQSIVLLANKQTTIRVHIDGSSIKQRL